MLEVGPLPEVERRKKVVVDHDGRAILVIAHEGSLTAMDNLCVHKDRELHKGVILRGRLICPGHQWAFDLATGWEATKERCQPVYDVVVRDGVVYVDTASRRTLDAAPASTPGDRG
jgi:nitrite reductase (NADH) small subunit